MLVLTVRNGEAVFILVRESGEKKEDTIEIKLSVVEITNSRVKLGFEASEDKVKIWREKIYYEILKGEKRKKILKSS
jgi:carbon storage regulator CsrA